jgi:hypothetical protein
MGRSGRELRRLRWAHGAARCHDVSIRARRRTTHVRTAAIDGFRSQAAPCKVRRMNWVQRYGKRVVPPLAVFLLARIVLVRASISTHNDGWSAAAWARWDSAHYLAIAKSGYEFFSCARVPGYDPTQFCGNTGWLPGFPLLIRALASCHMEPVFAGSLIAATFALGTLVLIWNTFLQAQLSVTNILTLLFIGFFPGHVYDHAVFPVSLCVFFQAAALYAHAMRRYAWAGVFGAVSAFSYGSGLFLAGVFGLDLLASARNERFPTLIRRILIEPGLVAVGFGLAMLVEWRDVGIWNGYFAVQAKYGYGPTPPWKSLAPHIHALLTGHALAPNIQTLFVACMVVVLLWAAAKAPHTKQDRVLAIFLLVYWLVPLSLGGNLSLYRAEAILLPGAPLVRKLPLVMLVGLVVAAMLISFRMALLFFNSVLV